MTKTNTNPDKADSKRRSVNEIDARATAARLAVRDVKQKLRDAKDNYKRARKQFKAAKKTAKQAEKKAAKIEKELRKAAKASQSRSKPASKKSKRSKAEVTARRKAAMPAAPKMAGAILESPATPQIVQSDPPNGSHQKNG